MKTHKLYKSSLYFVTPVFLALLLAGLLLFGVDYATASPRACVPGPHNGHITADETWCLSDSPHELSGDVTVDPGVTLTIEPRFSAKAAPGSTTSAAWVPGPSSRAVTARNSSFPKSSAEIPAWRVRSS